MRASTILASIAPACQAENFEELAALARLRRCHKFKIDLSVEATLSAIDYAHQMKDFGIFTLPFDECYFEIDCDDDRGQIFSLGALCWEQGGTVLGRIYDAKSGGKGAKTGGITIDLLSAPAVHRGLSVQECASFRKDVNPVVVYHDDEVMTVRELDVCSSKFCTLVAYAGVGSLTLAGVSRERIEAPDRLNKARAKSGKEPIHSYVVVRVKADPGKVGLTRLTTDGFRSPVRLHWRRGHIRRLRSGVLVQVRPCLVGDRSRGVITHDYAVSA